MNQDKDSSGVAVRTFNPERVSFLAEPDREYSAAIGAARTLPEVHAITKAYRAIADDAYRIAKKMTDADFTRFVVGRANEKKGKFDEANFDLTGPILMPAEMMKVSMVALQFNAPWGVVYNRLKEFGRLTITKGIVRVDVPMEPDTSATGEHEVTKESSLQP